MKVTRIQHVSVNVHDVDVESMQEFYAEVLGLTAADRPEIPGVPGAWFGAGDAQIHVVGAPALGSGIDPTGNHFCVMVEDLDAAVAELDAAGRPYIRAVQGADRVQIWITDPAGNTIELQQENGSA